ncbi:hypothetical protein Anas_03355 [Armadillidium nasatum]|uniref:BTB domain-containing protein n=1 Tax=Armadillidium nasatum TaxID=96803 RepID=A0A5N5T569_9CRUS|nr:hypothetical protein Anas_03355 [Armadillidium nasatum]
MLDWSAKGLLKGNPARSHLIKFNGYSYTSLRAVIDFMYNGKVMVEQENLAAFLKLGRALQVRGILDIAAQCEEAGLTTPEETKSNAQYSTTVQQSQKLNQSKALQQQQQQQQHSADSKKYAFLLDKAQQQKKPSHRKVAPNIIGSVDQQQQSSLSKVNVVQAAQHQQQVLQQQPQQQPQQQAQQQQQETTTTLEELQQALASGQAILQTADPNGGGEQTLQMMEGQCVVTGSGQTYVVVQEGENLSFVPAEMVQGDLQAAVNGGQVMETLDNVEQQLAQIESQVLTSEGQVLTSATAAAVSAAAATTQEDTGSLDTMSVVESLVKLGEKQPSEDQQPVGDEAPEIGPDMPCLDSEISDNAPQVGPDMPDLGGDTAEEQAVDDPEAIDDVSSQDGKIGGTKRKAETIYRLLLNIHIQKKVDMSIYTSLTNLICLMKSSNLISINGVFWEVRDQVFPSSNIVNYGNAEWKRPKI